MASLLSFDEAYPGINSLSEVNAITVVVRAIVVIMVMMEKTKIFSGLSFSVIISSNVSSLRITKRNLLRHRCTRVSFLLSFAIL